MCTKRRSWEYYLTRENKSDPKESQSCFSLNLSEMSTRTAIRNATESANDSDEVFQNKNGRINKEKLHGSKIPIRNCCKKCHEDVDSDQKYEKVSSCSFNFSDLSAKTLPRNVSTSPKLKSKFDTNHKLREIERFNELFMKRLLKSKPTKDIKKSTSEMTLLQMRSEKHVPPASIQRRQKQAEINTVNGIIHKKLTAIASKKF